MLSERTITAVIGIGMVCCGISLLIFAIMLGPYMNALSGTLFCIIAIPTAVILGFGISGLVMRGAGMALGHITIRVEPCGGK